LSHPRAASGQIKVKYGKREGDLLFCHGDGTRRADALLLLGALTQDALDADFGTHYRLAVSGQFGPSALKELEDRGYDPTTLEVSIRKAGDAKVDGEPGGGPDLALRFRWAEKELGAAQEDAHARGAGYLRVNADGTIERIDPDLVTVRPAEDGHVCLFHLAMDGTCMQCGGTPEKRPEDLGGDQIDEP